MPRITFIEHGSRGGRAHVVDATSGLSLMRAAVDHDVPGIDADCGGACACATCHVYVPLEWAAATGSPGTMEEEMLSFSAAVRPESRLACQIPVTDALDGLVVTLPDGQH